MDGFLVVDKPVGVTSHTVVATVRRVLGIKKAGHTGTLDPFATGVLPIAVGEATKAIQFLDESFKAYQAVMRLGISTDTQDCTGKETARGDYRQVTEQSINDLACRMHGVQQQIPPMFSALKRDGVPLYKFARQGRSVERATRTISIHSLTIDSLNLPDVTFSVVCSRGTYVRTVASDFGDVLGCGAHLRALRRLQSGPFTLDGAIPMDELVLLHEQGSLETGLLSPNQALAHLTPLQLTNEGAVRARHGKLITETCFEELPDPAMPQGQLVRLIWQDKLVAVACCAGETGQPAVKTFRLSRGFA